MKTLIAVLGVIGVILAILIGSYISAHNFGNQMEKQVEFEYENLQNVLAQYGLKVQEAAQVPDMKRDDLAVIMQEAMSGRYGEDGSQATFQWIQENYPGAVTDTLYSQIQQIMEAGRNDFQNAQTRFIDIKRTYDTALGTFYRGLWLRIAGYPNIDLDDFATVTSERARNAFETGVEDAIQLRP